MGKTSIGWCHFTFNCWWGCFKISPGCKNCYASAFDNRIGGEHWGETAPRRFFDDAHWAKPRAWNRAAEKAGVRRRVFCASMADVFEDRADLIPHRERLWTLIALTPMLDWLLLTKRPQNIRALLPKGPVMTMDGYVAQWSTRPWPNVWLGATVENADYLHRLDHLLAVEAAVHFVSYEPALGPVDLTPWLRRGAPGYPSSRAYRRPRVGWVIAGCESGRGPTDARPYDVAWFRAVRDQCHLAEVPFLLKQATDVAEIVPGRGIIESIGIGKGSTVTKKKNGASHVIEAPYLDGRQYMNFPVPEAA